MVSGSDFATVKDLSLEASEHFKNFRFAQARALWMRAIMHLSELGGQNKGQSISAYLGCVADCYSKEEQHTAAEKTIRLSITELLTCEPSRCRTLLMASRAAELGICLKRQGKSTESESVIAAAIEVDPELVDWIEMELSPYK